jgi:lysophospholipase L1-like esterase
MPSTVLVDRPVLRGAVQLGLILMLAAASFRLIEDPIRRRASAPRPVRARGLAVRAFVLVPAATVALVVWPLSCRPPIELEALASEPVQTAVVETPASAMPPPPVVDAKAPAPLWTSCQEVDHVGDSTSLGLVSRQLLPNVDDQIAARYRAVGVERFWSDISGARSMVETYKDQPNATEIVKRRRTAGYKGCYVLALGTNDPANTSGNVAMLSTRIDAMMAQIRDKPALWTTTKTLKEKGPYQNAHMASWNETLIQACTRHPNMRVYDWASEVQDDWFTADGIHFNAIGYRERAARLAKALARAFPKDGSQASRRLSDGSASECLVHATD